jgi:hypothetical protein
MIMAMKIWKMREVLEQVSVEELVELIHSLLSLIIQDLPLSENALFRTLTSITNLSNNLLNSNLNSTK